MRARIQRIDNLPVDPQPQDTVVGRSTSAHVSPPSRRISLAHGDWDVLAEGGWNTALRPSLILQAPKSRIRIITHMINVALRKRSLIQGPIDDTTTIALKASILHDVDGGCGRTGIGRGGCCSCCSGVARAGGADAAELRLAAGGDGFVGEPGGLGVDGCGVGGAEGGVGGVDWASGCGEEGAVAAGGEILSVYVVRSICGGEVADLSALHPAVANPGARTQHRSTTRLNIVKVFVSGQALLPNGVL